jgi:hypothetical protein
VLVKMNEVTVSTSDGLIVIEQNSIEGRVATCHEITLDAYQIPLLCGWLQQAAAEVAGDVSCRIE